TGGALGCSTDEPQAPARARGALLFDDPQLSRSSSNRYACSTCHDTEASPSGSPGTTASKLRKPGAPLAGVTQRASYWNGQENDLLRAMDACLFYFMGSSEKLDPTEPGARALYAYLESLEPGNAAPVPFSLVRNVEDVPRGDASAGGTLFELSCAGCHGTLHDGQGRLTERAPILPEQTLAEHQGYSARLLRLVFIEKTRHGAFFGYGGTMPPFSKEVLSDAELGSILEYLELRGE
ncbi:MAG TPA: c-type cytochrome, partial [Polyangiaceae bacterium]|nr:c-type cytochrome [Polyangiaceae bacterium]